MPFFLIPVGLAIAGAAGGAVVTQVVAKKREEKLEEVLAEAMNEVPEDKKDKVFKALSPEHLARIKGRAVGLRARAEGQAVQSGAQAKEKLAPSKVKGFARQGLVTPLEALGGW